VQNRTVPAASAPAPAAPAGSVEAVSAKVLPSVVKLQVQTGQQGGEGSGIVLTADGLILTNNHVIAEANQTAAAQDSLPRSLSPGGGLPRGMTGGGQTKATVTLSDGRTVPFTV